jgi:hypothetical protein
VPLCLPGGSKLFVFDFRLFMMSPDLNSFLCVPERNPMRQTGWRSAGLSVLITAVMVSLVHAQQPTIVFSTRGIDALVEDAEFVGAEVGQNDVKEKFENFVEGLPGGKGLAGLDRSKPFGIYWNATAGGPPAAPVAFLPVSDEDDLIELLKTITPDFKDSNGKWTMTFNGTRLVGQVSGKYLFLSVPGADLSKLPDPLKISNANYDLALEVNVAGVPDQLKQLFLVQLESAVRDGLAEEPDPENEAEQVGREIGIKLVVEPLKAIVKDGDKLTLGLNVDQKGRLAALDFGVTGKSNSALAKTLSAYGQIQPAFAALGSDGAPLRVIFSCLLPQDGVEVTRAFDAIQKVAKKEIEKNDDLNEEAQELAQKFAGRLIDIARGAVKSGSLHGGVAIEGGREGGVRVISGVRMPNANDAAKLLDDILELAKDEPGADKIKLDVAKHSGARIHQLDADENVDELLGDEPLHLAFRPDSVWLSAGRDNLTSLKQALDQSGKPARKGVSPIAIQVKPAALVVLLEKNDKDLISRAKKVAGKPGDKLNVEIAPVASGIKLRVEVGTDLLQMAK